MQFRKVVGVGRIELEEKGKGNPGDNGSASFVAIKEKRQTIFGGERDHKNSAFVVSSLRLRYYN